MNKRALRKDFYMEIRRSPGRFLSIFLIVAIGVAFFSGIRATEPDMRYTADAYSDKYQLMDLQVISTLGLTGEDQKALEQVEGIEKVEPGYSVDVLMRKWWKPEGSACNVASSDDESGRSQRGTTSGKGKTNVW